MSYPKKITVYLDERHFAALKAKQNQYGFKSYNATFLHLLLESEENVIDRLLDLEDWRQTIDKWKDRTEQGNY